MLRSIFSSACIAAAILASPTFAQIGNWDIIYQSLDTNFQASAANEVTLDYCIGTGRTFSVDLFDKGCNDPISGMTIVPSNLRTTGVTADHDGLKIVLDFDKTTITSSNIWSPGNKLEFCVRVQLLSGGSVINEDKRDIDIAFDFAVDFTTKEDVSMQPASRTSGSGRANVDSYVSACKCTDLEFFACNSNPLIPGSILNVCIKSMDPDVEIAFVSKLKLFQTNARGNETLLVVDGLMVQNEETSSVTVKNSTALGVSTIVPSRFFSYSAFSTATVSGMVQVKFVGSRRRHLVALGYDNNHASDTAISKPSYNKDKPSFDYEATRVVKKASSARAMRGEAAAPPGHNEESLFEIVIRIERHPKDIPHITTTYHSSGATNAGGAIRFLGATTCPIWAFLW